jgi:CBS-domain-containing membrane protein
MWRRFPVGVRAWLGIELNPVSHGERLVSAAGGFLGIFFILLASWAALGDVEAALLIVGSMGASAVLVFGVPHGPLSQPWALVGGHTVSALVGVAVAMLVPHPFVAAALAVGLAIGAMHYLRCIHPPGGATAITAVIGGPAVQALGFKFLLAPVLLNVAIILASAIVVNAFFAWRRYPAALVRRHKPDVESGKQHRAAGGLAHSDLEYALRQMNSMIDISETDLARIYDLAAEHAKSAHVDPWQVRLHHHYSNGRYGEDWAIRQVVDESQTVDPDQDLVIYKVVAGKDRRKSGVCTRAELARWARYEVFHDAGSWQRRPVVKK